MSRFANAIAAVAVATASFTSPLTAQSAPPIVQYITGGMVAGTSVARAFCPRGYIVSGGGGFSLNGAGLQQTHPISDIDGTVAWGSSAIGWQVAADDWSDVQAFVVCLAR
jgi:hypothetical protein